MYSMVCTCSDSSIADGYANLGVGYADRWWVHVGCRRPKESWLRSMGDDMLNYFVGGPLSGNAYATSTVLDHQDLMEGYHWTPEVVTSQKTGQTARVWKHDSHEAEQDQRDADLVTTTQEERPMATIAERRKGLKLSRQRLADLAGLSHSKIWRIENDGARTTDEERAAVNNALSKFEQDQRAQAGYEPSTPGANQQSTAAPPLPGSESAPVPS